MSEETRQIKYLALEGGGGKGNAYLGAIKALEEASILTFENNQLKGIQGISGASAGAITALLLGSGYSFDEIKTELQRTDFDNFLDGPDTDIITAGKLYDTDTRRIRTEWERQRGEGAIELSKKLYKLIKSGKLDSLSEIDYDLLFDCLVDIALALIMNEVIVNEGEMSPHLKKLVARLKSNFMKFTTSLKLYYGLFTGREIHRWFHRKILEKIRLVKNIPPGFSMEGERLLVTFQEHQEIFNTALKFTSVNIETGNVHVFSNDTTPRFPVATAARMSMSLPGIYKPVHISESYAKEIGLDPPGIWAGFWVDGGLFNNAPIKLWESDEAVLLRLGDRKLPKFSSDHSLFDFLSRWIIDLGVFGSGSGQVTESTFKNYNSHIIELDIAGLDLLKFNLDQQELLEVIDRNYNVTKSHIESHFKVYKFPPSEMQE